MIPKTWSLKPLKEIISSIEAGTSVNSEDRSISDGEKGVLKVSCVTYGVFAPEEHKAILKDEEGDVFIFPKKNNILVSRANTPKFVGASVYIDRDYPRLFLSDKLWQLTVDDKFFSILWLIQALNSEQVRSVVSSTATGSSGSMKNISQQSFLSIKVLTPPIAQQKKIAEILGTWDEAIGAIEKLIAAKQKLKKALDNRLLFGKTRFSNSVCSTFITHQCFSIPQDWGLKELSQLFQERRETSSDLDTFDLASLTIEFGLIAKPTRYNREFLLRDKENNQYRLVHTGDFVYNPMNLRWGAIDCSRHEEPVLISAYYNVLIPNTEIIPSNLLLAILTSHQMIHVYNNVGIGSLAEKTRVHLKDFLKLKVPVPPLSEAIKIDSVLSSLNKEIIDLTRYKDLLQQQKRGLMQKLLTGQWRVNTEE
jgi:type I restriction enzyme, S subunit